MGHNLAYDMASIFSQARDILKNLQKQATSSVAQFSQNFNQPRQAVSPSFQPLIPKATQQNVVSFLKQGMKAQPLLQVPGITPAAIVRGGSTFLEQARKNAVPLKLPEISLKNVSDSVGNMQLFSPMIGIPTPKITYKDLSPTNEQTPILGGIRKFQRESAEEAIAKFENRPYTSSYPENSLGRYSNLSARYMETPQGQMDILMSIGGGGSSVKKYANYIKANLDKEAIEKIGLFGEIVESGKGKAALGKLGQEVQAMATDIFGEKARTLSNTQLKNLFDVTLKQVGKTKNKLGLGLMAEDLREGLTEAQQKAKAKLPDLLYQSREEKVAEQMAARAKRVSEPLPWEPKVAATGKVLENPAVEGRQFVQEMADEARRIKDPQNNSLPFEDVLNKATDVKNKVHIFDYLRTPQNVLNKIGMGDEAKLIDKKWNDYLDDLPIEINKVTEWSKRAPRESKEIFRWLDGNKTQTLSPEAKTVALEIQDYLKSWADKLQLPEDKRVSDYITRIFDKDFSGKEFPDELAKLIQDTVPSSTYNPFTMKRLGAQGYKEDTWQALDAYIKRSVRAYHMDQALSRVSMKASTLETTQYNYVKRHIDQIQMRPTEIDTLIDNFIKSSPVGYRLGQRPVAAVTQKARQMVYRGLIGLNPKIALQNLTQASNTYSVLGERYTLLGYSKVAQNLPKFLLEMETELEKTGLLRENIIQDRTINATRKTWEKADKGLFYLFSNAEKINRGAAYWGAKAKALDQGKSEAEAIRFAKDIVATTQFEYSRISTPVALGSDLAKTFFQFASFPVKQTEFLAGLAKKKDFAGLIRWTASSFAMVYTLGQLWGMKLEDLNPLGRYTEKGILGLPTPPTLQLPNEVYKSAVNAPDQYGNVSDEQNPLLRIAQSPGVLKGVMNYIPAGGQIMKSYQGIKSYQQGESLTPSGRTRFEIPQTSENAIKTALFGQYAVKEGRDYIENLGKSANVKFVETIGLEGNQLKEAKQKLKGQSAFSDRQKASIKKGGVDVMDTILERREKTKTLKAVIADYDSVNAQIKELVVSGRPEEARPLIIQNRELLAKGKVMKNFETRYNKLYMSLEALYANPRLSTEQKAKVATVLKKQIETLDIAYKNFNSR